MKVLFDHQIFTIQQYGGISRYFYELIRRFDGNENSAFVSSILSNNEYISSGGFNHIKSFFPSKTFKGKDRLLEFVNKNYSVSRIRGAAFDIFHPTYYNPYFLKGIKAKPFVVTVLDMIHEKFAMEYKELGSDKELFSNKKSLITQATKIIAISQSTKNDIIEIFGIADNRIEVVHLGSSFNSHATNSQSLINNPYLLFVGTRASYKNFSFYLESVADILKREKIMFICAGGGTFTHEELAMIQKLGLQNLVFHYQINDDILSSLYRHAKAFVFPSKYEGFGIPVLEAFSCGCPCLLSNGGSLPEVGGQAALYFDPYDANDIKRNFEMYLSNEQIRDNIKKLGRERLELFSWEKTFQETLDVYQSIL